MLRHRGLSAGVGGEVTLLAGSGACLIVITALFSLLIREGPSLKRKTKAKPSKQAGKTNDQVASKVSRANPARDEVEALLRNYHRTHNPEIRQQLVTRSLPLIRQIVERLRTRLPVEVDDEDMMQEGVFGLMDAIEGFDPSRGFRFSTFASPRILGAIVDYLRSIDWAPRLVRARARIMEQARRELTAALHRPPTDAEVSAHLGISRVKFNRIRRDAQLVQVTSLDATHNSGPESDGASAIDMVADHRQVQPLSQVQRQDLRQLLQSELSRAERLIVVLYYFEGMTMKEIGTTLDLSESRVSQMHSSILARLKSQFKPVADACVTV